MHKSNQHKRAFRTRIKLKQSRYPRLVVFRSNKNFYAQVIDKQGKVLAAASEKDNPDKAKKSKTDKAKEVGQILAKKALAKKIRQVVLDRGAYRYHGRVKEFTEAVRKAGLII